MQTRARFPAIAVAAAAALALVAACKHETPIQRAQRVCIEQENAKVSKDASQTVKDLADAAARAVCSAGPAICSADPDGAECKKFIDTYR